MINRAEWIWCSGEDTPKNFYLYCRRSFKIDEPVSTALIHISADSRYKLFVNGVFLGRGPARCDPRWQYYDTYDIAPHLRNGENTIGVIVHQFGVPTHSYLVGRGGFFLQGDIVMANNKPLRLDTGQDWRVLPSPAWDRNVPRGSFAIMWEEIFDARREPEGWKKPGFDDSAWELPVRLGAPPVPPWEHMVPRDIPFLREEEFLPTAILDSGTVDPAPLTATLNLGEILNAKDKGNVAYLFVYLHSPIDQRVALAPRGRMWPIPRHIWANGKLYCPEAVWQDGSLSPLLVDFPIQKGWNELMVKVGRDYHVWILDLTLGPFGDQSFAPVTWHAQQDLNSPANTLWVVGPYEGTRANTGKEGFHTPYEFEELVLNREVGSTIEVPGQVVHLDFQPGKNVAVDMAFAPRHSGCDNKLLQDIERLLQADGGPAHIATDAQTGGTYVTLDFGKVLSGYARVRLNGVSGGIVDLGYSEVLENGHVDPTRGKLCYADRYIMRDGPQTYELFCYKGFRYLQATFRNCPMPIDVDAIRVNFVSYPVRYRGGFECSDPLLNKIWETGRWTLQLCMHDAYEDTPWREQGQWCGDAEVELLGNYMTFGDVALGRKCIRQIAEGQEPDGNLPMMYPALTHVIPHGIPQFVAQYVSMLATYYQYTADHELVSELYPCIQRVIAYFDKFLDGDHLLADVPGFPFLDWMLEPELMPMFGRPVKGQLTGMNCLYYRALRDAAELAKIENDPKRAKEWSEKASRIHNAINRLLWSDNKNVYIHGRIDGCPIERVAVHDSILATFCGIASRERAEQSMSALFDSSKLNPVQIGTPYFYFFYLGALRQIGRHEQALDATRDAYGMMLREGATAWWEQFNRLGSFSHAWSCAPSSDLPAWALGVCPTEPGFASFRVEPHRADLTWAKGRVPTINGDIAVEWSDGEVFELTVNVPFVAQVNLSVPAKNAESALQTQGKKARAIEFKNGRAGFLVEGPGMFGVRSVLE